MGKLVFFYGWKYFLFVRYKSGAFICEYVMLLCILTWALARLMRSFPEAGKFVVTNIMHQGVMTIYVPLQMWNNVLVFPHYG